MLAFAELRQWGDPANPNPRAGVSVGFIKLGFRASGLRCL